MSNSVMLELLQTPNKKLPPLKMLLCEKLAHMFQTHLTISANLSKKSILDWLIAELSKFSLNAHHHQFLWT
jgi:hypothetical protein